MDKIEKLFLENKAWSEEKREEDPDYFKRLAKEQNPHFLWIGCSDSRVPANEITNTEPGDVFVHRNVANMVVHTDLNLLSVLQYSVEVLKIEHIIVCGHYGCGGIKAALNHQSLGIINKWLRNIKDVYRLYENEIKACPTEQEQFDKLVECNVKEQVFNLAKTSIVQQSWKNGEFPHIHGWVYALDDGILNSVCKVTGLSDVDQIYHYEFPS